MLFSKPFVAGNEADMTLGAIALIANDDNEAGKLAADEILSKSLLTGQPLQNFPILQCKQHKFGVNRKVARKYGIQISEHLFPKTTEYDN